MRYLTDGAHTMRVFQLPPENKDDAHARHKFDIELPGLGNTESISARSNDTDFFYKFSSFSDPGAIYHIDFKKEKKPNMLW